jgi:hypothetical protein
MRWIRFTGNVKKSSDVVIRVIFGLFAGRPLTP